MHSLQSDVPDIYYTANQTAIVDNIGWSLDTNIQLEEDHKQEAMPTTLLY